MANNVTTGGARPSPQVGIRSNAGSWTVSNRYLDDGAVPINNNAVENQIRQWALGRWNWPFAESLRGGKRAAAIMSLIQSARMNGRKRPVITWVTARRDR